MAKLWKFNYKGTTHLGETKLAIGDKIIRTVELSGEDAGQLRELIEAKAKPYTFLSKCKDLLPTPKKKHLKMSEAVSGAAALLRVIKGDVESQGEINRRSGICSFGYRGKKCPKLTSVSNCRACGFGAKLVEWKSTLKKVFGIKDLEIPNGHADKYCQVCECSLTMMLPSKTQAFDFNSDRQKERPAFCWIKKSSENFIESNQ